MFNHYFRSTLFNHIRSFFDHKGYVEVDTPLLSPHLIPESCLEVFKTEKLFPENSAKKNDELYLIPSPEVYMKKIIAENKKSIYQICHCFRNGESEGKIHASEFTMLEYYTMDADYLDSISITEELFLFLLETMKEFNLDGADYLRPPFLRTTINEAFIKYAGFDLFAAVNDNSLVDKARDFGIIDADKLTTQVLYDLIFVTAVEPALAKEKAVVLMDYPAFVPTLAELNADGKTRQRFELYSRGVELANCYSEERDPERVKLFFENEAWEKSRSAIVKHNVDEGYYKTFIDFPRCSGVALGLDRLIMLLTGGNHI
jgi:lysyl-tRNA synthetase class 2